MGVVHAVFPVGIIVRGEELAGKRYDSTEITLVTRTGETIYETGPFHFLEE